MTIIIITNALSYHNEGAPPILVGLLPHTHLLKTHYKGKGGGGGSLNRLGN